MTIIADDNPFLLFRDDIERRELTFDRPDEIMTARTLSELSELFEKMQSAHRSGMWLAGFFTYEAGFLFEPKLHQLLPRDRRLPLAMIGIFNAPTRRMHIRPPKKTAELLLREPRAEWTLEAYEDRFNRVHQHLRSGDCYQANLTFPIRSKWQGDPFAIFNDLAGRQPVKHSAYVSFASTKILSRSPELFFKVGKTGWIESLPMKGTAKRGHSAAADAAQIRFLKNDPKNQAENRMIVDLLRNDISRISETGTLSVPKLFEVETYSTLHQMVSLVRAKLLPNITIRDLFAALFPCGSITGAPKLRAMQILRQLESQPRDCYCGSIGWIAPDGQMQFNVAIRTLTLFPGGEAVFNVGGGVVFDSTAAEEYAECLLKARFALGNTTILN